MRKRIVSATGIAIGVFTLVAVACSQCKGAGVRRRDYWASRLLPTSCVYS